MPNLENLQPNDGEDLNGKMSDPDVSSNEEVDTNNDSFESSLEVDDEISGPLRLHRSTSSKTGRNHHSL
jgi:hypothetical protein